VHNDQWGEAKKNEACSESFEVGRGEKLSTIFLFCSLIQTPNRPFSVQTTIYIFICILIIYIFIYIHNLYINYKCISMYINYKFISIYRYKFIIYKFIIYIHR